MPRFAYGHYAKGGENMASNLKTPMPATPSFTYGTSGKTEKAATKVIKGGDLRAKPGQNNGAGK